MFLYSNIKTLRKQKGWNQSQLAEKIDKTYITVGDYERGKILPPLNVILKLCDIFGVGLETMVYHDIAGKGTPTTGESVEDLQTKLQTQQRIIRLQEQRLAELEREIREHAPELIRRLGL